MHVPARIGGNSTVRLVELPPTDQPLRDAPVDLQRGDGAFGGTEGVGHGHCVVAVVKRGVEVGDGPSGGKGGENILREAGAGVSGAGAQEGGLLQGQGTETLQDDPRVRGQAEGLFAS